MDDVVNVLQSTVNKLYLPDESGDFAAGSQDEALNILLGTQKKMYHFVKTLVKQYEDEFDALAVLAEVDHRLSIPDDDFKFDYDVENTGSCEVPYTLFLKYGDPALGFVKISVNSMSQ